jgi:hypothetical protein
VALYFLENIIELAVAFTILALLISLLSALYARRALNESKKANDIGRLNSLLALRVHYLQLMEHQHKVAELMPSNSKGMQSVRNTYCELDGKLREVNSQIDSYHNKVVSNEI